jgi:hypothetical protein
MPKSPREEHSARSIERELSPIAQLSRSLDENYRKEQNEGPYPKAPKKACDTSYLECMVVQNDLQWCRPDWPDRSESNRPDDANDDEGFYDEG